MPRSEQRDTLKRELTDLQIYAIILKEATGGCYSKVSPSTGKPLAPRLRRPAHYTHGQFLFCLLQLVVC
jgi:hypothetical protein